MMCMGKYTWIRVNRKCTQLNVDQIIIYFNRNTHSTNLGLRKEIQFKIEGINQIMDYG
jgi:hypothetical protein